LRENIADRQQLLPVGLFCHNRTETTLKESHNYDPSQKFGHSLDDRDPETIVKMLPVWEWLYRYYFRVTTDGWENIPPTGQFLFVGSHNGGMAAPDMSMMMYDWFTRFGTDRVVYGLMHPKALLLSPSISQLAVKVGAVVANPRLAIEAFQRGASVLVYPGGIQDVFRPHSQRDKIYFAKRKGFIKLALRQGVPIIPLISKGAHDTLIVLGDCYDRAKELHRWGMPWLMDIDPEVLPIYLGLPWGIGIGPLMNIPLPVAIHTRVCPPITFTRYGKAASLDRAYVDECYDRVVAIVQAELDRLFAERQNG
jgi:1-acyl-sn-glycerol-3-phosphate acyltransferase